jgi:hypothetical protein
LAAKISQIISTPWFDSRLDHKLAELEPAEPKLEIENKIDNALKGD